MLGEKYIASIKEVATSASSKTVILPADLMKTLEGMLGGKRSA